jgi:hypothetical protein
MPDQLDAKVLDILKGRGTWRRGQTSIGVDEVRDLLEVRFGTPRPTRAQVKAIVQRLARHRHMSWAVTKHDGIIYLL